MEYPIEILEQALKEIKNYLKFEKSLLLKEDIHKGFIKLHIHNYNEQKKQLKKAIKKLKS